MRTPWKNYFFTVDFSNAVAFLKDKPVGYVFDGDIAVTLATLLQEHDPRPSSCDQWCCVDDPRDFNVQGAEVLYNGPNHPDFPTNARFTHVMRLAFPEDNTCPHAPIHLQYNLPTGV